MAQIIGRQTVNDIEILQVDGDPSAGAGTVAPIASLALFDSGTIGRLYIKSGLADTAWQTVDTQIGDDWNLDGNDLSGATADAPVEFFGSTNDYDVIFKRNNAEIFRLVNDGLLLGLQASTGGKLQISQALGAELLKQISPSGGVGGASVIKVSRQYKVQTTDDTLTTLASIAIPTNTRCLITADISCNQHGGTAGSNGDGASYKRTIDAKNIGGTVTIEKWTTDFTSEDVKAFRVSRAVNTTNVDISVEGEVDRDLAWFANVTIQISGN